MTTKHTPGPWKRCGEDRDGCPCGLVYATGADFGIATTYLSEYGFEAPMPDVEARKANARLIAAAPEMLETLEWLDSIGGLGATPHERIRAAIAKATGAA